MSIHSPEVRSDLIHADYHHLRRIASAAGIPAKDPKIVDPEDLRVTMELDYYLWQQNIPRELRRDSRYDHVPNVDPLEELFKALPTIEEDDLGSPDDVSVQAVHDARFVHALWPFANSGLHYVATKSSDPHATDIWWIARMAFSLGDQKSYSNIRNYFMQGLTMVMHFGMSEKKKETTPTSRTSSNSNAGASQLVMPDRAKMSKKTSWIWYCYWISRGRPDKPSPIAAREQRHEQSSLDDTLGTDRCAYCQQRPLEVRPPGRLYRCGGCSLDWCPELRRQYCSEKCQRDDWKKHRPYYQQRKHFLRATYLLRSIAWRYQAATFTGHATMVSPAPTQPKIVKDGFATGKEGVVVAAGAFEEALWTGANVFPESAQAHVRDTPGSADVVAWDHIGNTYVHLRSIINDCLGPFCEALVEFSVYVRNGGAFSQLAADYSRELGVAILSKGREPMFHPHQVLYARLRHTRQEYIIDLNCAVFDWDYPVLPFDAFIQNRLASIVESKCMRTEIRHWCPSGETGLCLARDDVAWTILEDCLYFLTSRTKYTSLNQIAKLKEDSWLFHANDILTVTELAICQSIDKIRRVNKYRQYLVVDPNPYTHEFGRGVTCTADERALYGAVWMKKQTFDNVFKPFSEHKKQNRAGTETRAMCYLWVDKLRKMSKTSSFNVDAAAVLGGRARILNIGAELDDQDMKRMRDLFLTWQGTTDANLNWFFASLRRAQKAKLEDHHVISPATASVMMNPVRTFQAVQKARAMRGVGTAEAVRSNVTPVESDPLQQPTASQSMMPSAVAIVKAPASSQMGPDPAPSLMLGLKSDPTASGRKSTRNPFASLALSDSEDDHEEEMEPDPNRPPPRPVKVSDLNEAERRDPRLCAALREARGGWADDLSSRARKRAEKRAEKKIRKQAEKLRK